MTVRRYPDRLDEGCRVTAVAVPDDAAPGRAARGSVVLGDLERSLRTIAAATTVGLGLGFLVGESGGESRCGCCS
jgi:hypothetical protein